MALIPLLQNKEREGQHEQANSFLISKQEATKKWKEKLNEQMRSHSVNQDDGNDNKLLVKPQIESFLME
ncbi:MAG TPA: hypothetical protein VE076_04755 [Nitrososphaeraceae archaeon]|nr:hypothetical protein [Nitrososphaeraceae archaeon]